MLTVYSKNYCPFCDKAKHLLKLKNILFKFMQIHTKTMKEETVFLRK